MSKPGKVTADETLEGDVSEKREEEILDGTDNKEFFDKHPQVPLAVKKLLLGNTGDKRAAAEVFRKILSIEHNPPIAIVIGLTGVVEELIACLEEDSDSELQFEATWALTNIAAGENEYVMYLIKKGALPPIVKLLGHAQEKCREQAVWAVGNIAGDSFEAREELDKSDALKHVLKLIEDAIASGGVSTLRNATWALSNLFRHKPRPPIEHARACLPTLSKLISHHDTEVLTDALWALSYISDSDDDGYIEALVQTNTLISRIVVVVSRNLGNYSIFGPALRVVGNIVTGTSSQTRAVIKCGVLRVLSVLLSHERIKVVKEVLWMLSNILSEDPITIQHVLDANVLEKIRPFMCNRSEANDPTILRTEAFWAVLNFCSAASYNQLKTFTWDKSVFETFCFYLRKGEADKLFDQTLLALHTLVGADADGALGVAKAFDSAGGVLILENLQQSFRDATYHKASSILLRCYADHLDDDDDDDDDGCDVFGKIPERKDGSGCAIIPVEGGAIVIE